MRKDIALSCGFLSLCAAAQAAEPVPAAKRPNVLMILVDDLRPELGCYGNTGVISPNMDSLARSGVRFSNAYCNVPVSGASRASLLTGIRPGPGRFTSFEAYAQKDAPGAVSLPGHFRQNGYTTLSYSKVFHHQEDYADAWDQNWRPAGPGSWRNYVEEDNLAQEKQNIAPVYENADVPDNAYFDGETADRAVEDLRRLSNDDKPFFMAVGFLKPHLPFNAPKKYWDMYDGDAIELPANYRPMNNSIPQQAFHTWGELRFYAGIPKKGAVPEIEARRLIHGYRSCVSYVDAQIGKVLAALRELDLDKNTVVILFGDHGWSLGEHGEWCKHSTFDVATNAPMIVRATSLPQGAVIDELVEFVDIFPTLCDLCTLQKPEQLQGESFIPLIRGNDPQWKNSAVVQWSKGLVSITPDYAYTRWFKPDGSFDAHMLFDHTTDRTENYNIVDTPDAAPVVERMWRLIEQFNEKR